MTEPITSKAIISKAIISKAITYGAIENALVTLGFDITDGPDYRLYHHAGTDTTIITPDYPPEQAADEMRLATVRKMVVDRGVARSARLDHLLSNPPTVLRATTAKKSAVQIRHEIPAEVKA